MSRLEIPCRKPGFTVVVGWDNPMSTFFAQVTRIQNVKDDSDPVVLWLGGCTGEVRHAEDLVLPLQPFADLTCEHITQLRADRGAGGSRPDQTAAHYARPDGEAAMIRQYYAQRRRGGDNPLGVGVIAFGTVFYLQPEWWWRDRYRGAPARRDPHIVVGFLNGTMGAARRNHETGLWEEVTLAGRSDMAVIRSLRDGHHSQVAVRTLILHENYGLTRQPSSYPTLPDMRFRRAGRPQRRQAA